MATNRFAEPLLVGEQLFLRYVQLLDHGLHDGGVALAADEPYGVWELSITSADRLDLSAEDVEDIDDFASNLGQLLIFAGADAPDEVVSEWAKEVDVEPSIAVDRTRILRDNMPVFYKLWAAKTHARFPILTRVNADLISIESGPDHGLIRLSSAENLHAAFDRQTSETLTIEVWPDDLERLIVAFDALRARLTGDASPSGAAE